MRISLDEVKIRDDEAFAKFEKLRDFLLGKSAIISFSGGVDSSFLVLVASKYCENALAITADSPTLAPGELERARELARAIGINHRVIEYDELGEENFVKNPNNRCYYCKRGLIRALKEVGDEEGYGSIFEGTNASDIDGHRPGRRAVVECGATSPLLEAGLTKTDIRRLSMKIGLPTWDRPSMPCLASRIPYHSPISRERLERIGKAERMIRELGFSTVRVRDYGDLARIEIEKDLVPELVKKGNADKILSELGSLGFTHVTVDLRGYRSGSMNEVGSNSVL